MDDESLSGPHRLDLIKTMWSAPEIFNVAHADCHSVTGPGVLPQYQGCATTGATLGSTSLTGEEYLATAFEYSRSNLWRNFGVIIAFTVLYLLITFLGAELFSFVGSGGGAIIFKRGAKTPVPSTSIFVDAEKAGDAGDSRASSGQLNADSSVDEIRREKTTPPTQESESVFTWTNVEYSVPHDGGQLTLLNNVHGYAKPGVMVALMGASGAGKTTLLNTLSQRQRMGTTSGTMLANGRPLGKEFQRITGFVEQQYVTLHLKVKGLC